MLTQTQVFEMVADALIVYGPIELRSKTRDEVVAELNKSMLEAAEGGDAEMVKLLMLMFDKAYEAGKKATVDSMSDEARVQLFANYCKSCGTPDPSCKCWNDD